MHNFGGLKSHVSQPLTIALPSRTYPIHFVEALATSLADEVVAMQKAGRRCVLLSDVGVATAQAGLIEQIFPDTPKLILEAGERSKSLEAYGRVLDFLADNRLGRDGVLWALGGGVIGDLAGFAAASYLRGIECVQVPTTLLAMVDSSVGGKTGINLAAGKNLVGAFHHPLAVWIAPSLLHTLPPREFAAGAAEVVKYGLLADATLLAQLEKSPLAPTHPELAAIIRRCCEIKAAIVQADEREIAREGGRALLNLGHTFGHAIEQVAGYGEYLHGEAVGVGLVAAAQLSQRLGLIGADEVARVERVVAAHGLPVALRAALRLPALMAAMSRDKKNRAGGLRFVVLEKLGQAATRSDVPVALVEEIWVGLGAKA